MADLSAFEKSIGVKFKNKELLKQAFTHRSYLNEYPALGLVHNERLEFLGDAVLELVVTEHLFKEYPQKTEGEMTALRASLVNANMLSAVSDEISMGDYMFLSKGETKSLALTGNGRRASTKAGQYILANAFEALVGAIYIEHGYEKSRLFLKKFLFPKLEEIIEKKLWIDAKSLFQEKAQEKENITPSYKVLKEAGPDHEKVFTIGVYLGDKIAGEGRGASKQEAEQNAARNALKHKNWFFKLTRF